MKVLILGGKGALGLTFADVYKDQQVTSWDREELDVTDEAAAMKKISELKPELIINCAAYNAVDKAEEDRQAAELLNASAVGFIAKAAGAVKATVVHFSTAYVFDGVTAEGYNEDDKPNPQSVYAKSKYMGELELAENTDNFYLIRTTWLYGRHSDRGKPSFVDTMVKMVEENKPIKAITDEFGQPTNVKDLANATRKLVDQKTAFGIYHLTNLGQASWYDWAKEIFKIKVTEVNIEMAKRDDFNRAAKRPQYGVLNNTKFIQLRSWTEALKEYLKK